MKKDYIGFGWMIIKCVSLTVCLFILVGCKVQYIEREVTKTVEVHHRDTAVVTQADSASIYALVKCDSTNKAYIDYIDYQDGRINSLSAQITDGRLKVHSYVKTDTVLVTLHDTVTTIIDKQNKREEVEKKGFLWYSGIMFWVLFGLLIAGVVVGIVIKFAK